jgi:hypothetical protein
VNGEEATMAKKRKDGWSVRVTGEFDNDLDEEIFEELKNHSFLGGFFEWMGSPDGQLCDEVTQAVWQRLKTVDVDAANRKLLWEDGSLLGIEESVQRLNLEYPQFPLEPIESSLTSWLEMEFSPESYSQEQLDELDRLTAAWVKDHERRRTAP